MTQLPTPGGDNDIWGVMLNDFLAVAHNPDGSLQQSAVSNAGGYIVPSAGIPATALDSSTQSIIQSVVGKYVKPVSGIPGTDMASAVQTSLGLANTALQLGGDLGGTTSAPILTKLQGTTVNAAAPTDSQVLSYNSASNSWVPSTVTSTTVNDATTSTPGLIQLAGDLGGTATSPSVLRVNGITLPGSAPTGSGQVLTTTTTSTTAWSTPSANATSIDGVTVSGTPSSGQALVATGGNTATWTALPSAPVTSVNSQTGAVVLDVSSLGDTSINTPANSQVLTYNGTTNKWTNQPASGAVSSVFGRTGTVIAQAGDYTASQVGALPNTDDLSTIANTNVTAGDVSMNNYKITNLTNGTTGSDAATFGQIPTSLPPSGAAGGDFIGSSYPNPTLAATTNVEDIISNNGTVTSKAPLASPAFTGIPTAPTASVGTNTTQIATTAFVQTATSDASSIDGVVVSGTPSQGQVLTATSGSTAGWQNAPVDWLNVVTAYGADPTGASDASTAIQNAVNACISQGGGVIYFPKGSYKVSSTITCDQNGVPIYFLGDGTSATILKFYGTGDCIRHYDSSTYTTRTHGGGFQGICIDGTNAGNNSAGLHMGDIFRYVMDLRVVNFAGTGSIGAWLQNSYYWSEQMQGKIRAEWSTRHVVFDVNASGAATTTGSFMRMSMLISVEGAGDGVVFQNGTYPDHGRLEIVGNFNSSSTPVNTAVLRLTGSIPAGLGESSTSHITDCLFSMGCESGNGAYTPQTIIFGSSSNFINAAVGRMAFIYLSPSNNQGNVVRYYGIIDGDASLVSWESLGRTNISDGTQAISSTTAVNVTGVWGTVAAWTPYSVKVFVPYYASITSGTPVFSLTGPATVYVSLGVKFYSPSGCVGYGYYSSLTGFTGPTLSNTLSLLCEIEGSIMFSGYGILQLQAAEGTSGDGYTVTIGSSMVLTPMIAS